MTNKTQEPIETEHLGNLVKEWNSVYKVGQKVTYENDDGQKIITSTRSEAWLLGNHSAVIMIEGRPGCVDLARVFIAQEELPLNIKRVAVWDNNEGISLSLKDEETENYSDQLPWPSHWPEIVTAYIVEKEGFEIEYT